MAAILEKSKNRHILATVWPIDQIWHGDAVRPSSRPPIHGPKIVFFWGGEFDPLNGEAYQRIPQKAQPWTEHHMT